MHAIEEAIQFLKLCEENGDLTTAISDFREIIERRGFRATAIGAWIGEGKNRLHRFYFNDWPDELCKLHHGDEDCIHDPIVIEASRTIRPFLWTEISARVHPDSRGMAIIDGFEKFGWRDVFAVPVHGPAGYVGLIALGAKSGLKLTIEECAALELMRLPSIAVAMNRKDTVAVRPSHR